MTADDFFQMKKETGCDAVMIGRGLIGNPFLIKEITDILEGKEKKEITLEDKLNCCLEHARKLIGLKGEKLAMGEMRGIAPHYLSGMYHASIYKAKLNQVRSYDELEMILDEYKKFLAQR